jgi:hypothetical protein
MRLAAAGVTLAAVAYPWIPVVLTTARDPVTGRELAFHRTHAIEMPLVLTWGMEGLRDVPYEAILAFAIVIGALCVYPWERVRSPSGPARERRLSLPPASLVALAAGAGAVLCVVLRFPYPSLFGDAVDLPSQVGAGAVYAAEAGTMQLFQLARHALGGGSSADAGLRAIVVVDDVAGALFVGALASFALTVGRDPAERWVLFLGPVAAGCTGMFFGYVETTQVESAAMALYFAASARWIARPPAASRPGLARMVALAALGFAVTGHGAGVLLLPSAALLLADVFTLPRPDLRALARRVLTPANFLGVVALVLLPFWLVVERPFYSKGDFGNATGGGDHIQWVPLSLDYAHRPSEWVYYSLLSPWHLADLASAIFFTAPFALPLSVAAAGLRRADGGRLDHDERAVLTLLATAAATCAVIPVFWNHDFGMWGDWNLAATYLFPAHVASWVAFVVASRRFERPLSFYVGIAAPVLLAQVLASLGLLAQLY